MKERRRFIRANHRISLLFYLAENGTEIRTIVGRNISEGGLLLISEEAVPDGTAIHVEVDFHDNTKPELVHGTVARCAKLGPGVWGWGVDFGAVSDGLRAQIRAFVLQHEAEEPLSEIERYLLDDYIDEVKKRAAEKIGVPPIVAI